MCLQWIILYWHFVVFADETCEWNPKTLVMLQRSRHEDDSLITVSVISGRVNRMWVKRHQYPAARRPPPSSINDKPCQPERNPLADHDDSVFHRRLQRGREISCAAARTDSRSPPTQPRRFLGPRLPGLWTTVIGCGGSELAARSDSRHGQLSRVTATGSEWGLVSGDKTCRRNTISLVRLRVRLSLSSAR